MAQHYTRTAIGLHWIIALLIVAAFLLGLIMSDMPPSMTKIQYFSWHKSLGVTIFLLAIIRVGWRLTHPVPPMVATIPKTQKFLAAVVHYLLYFLIFAAPLSGYFYSLAAGFPVFYLGVIPLPSLISAHPEIAETLKSIHELMVYTMAALVGAHVLVALKHYFIDHDEVLARMLPFLKK